MRGFSNSGRDALLLETLGVVAKTCDFVHFWPEALAQLKWILDFSRVDVAMRNADGVSYSVETVFELRPDLPFTSERGVPLHKGMIGRMLQTGEACHCFHPRSKPFAKEFIVDDSLEGGSLESMLCVRLDANDESLGFLSFGSSNDTGYSRQDVLVASRFAAHAALAIQNRQRFARLEAGSLLLDLASDKLKRSHELLEALVSERTAALRSVSQRLVRAQDEERRKISRDLHDSTGQTIVALKMKIAALQKRSRADLPISDALDELFQLADQAYQEIRTTTYLLHPPLLDEAGFNVAAHWYLEGFSQRSGIIVHLDVPLHSNRLPSNVEMALFRVLQESLTNIHRHSGASTARVELRTGSGVIYFTVEDNGHGIPPELLYQLQTGRGSGVGLAGMRERIGELGGEFGIDSGSTGTTLRIRIPLPPASSPASE